MLKCVLYRSRFQLQLLVFVLIAVNLGCTIRFKITSTFHFELGRVPWRRIPGGLIQIDTGYSRAVWGVNRHHQIWKLKQNRMSWKRVGGRLMQISAGEGGVWGVNKHHQIFYRWGAYKGKFRLGSKVCILLHLH